ncbi:MAG: exodeoxyribonuclease III [Rickettsiales bacterium]|jgi:exodeoxyribonuclease-3|nr:exodeoxyribonuclease III [Rickettsiales bacterium]
MKIASFNVNSIRAHLENVLNWANVSKPDIILLQELKCEEHCFPFMDFEMLGYNIQILGQKSWNGVAVLSKHRIEDVYEHLPCVEDTSRYLEVFTGGIRVASIYAPNGNPTGTEKFAYKLKWMECLENRMRELAKLEEPVIIGGDFNVIPKDMDVYNPKLFKDDAVMQPEIRKAFADLQTFGFKSAKEILYPQKVMYSYWDYRFGARQNNKGILLDFFLLNQKAQDLLKDFYVEDAPRDQPKSSDHTAIVLELNQPLS